MAEEQSTQRLPPKTTNIKVERSIFWKIYFYIIIAITLLDQLMVFFDIENMRIWDIINVPVMTVAIIGLYGFVFSRKFFKQNFWLYFLVFIIIWDAVAIFVIGMPPVPDLTETEIRYIYLFSIAFVYILSTPAYIGLLLYGLPSNKLWKDDSV